MAVLWSLTSLMEDTTGNVTWDEEEKDDDAAKATYLKWIEEWGEWAMTELPREWYWARSELMAGTEHGGFQHSQCTPQASCRVRADW